MYTMKWTSDNIPDQHGRVALVTDANSGIGFETALMLSKKRAEVILLLSPPIREGHLLTSNATVVSLCEKYSLL